MARVYTSKTKGLRIATRCGSIEQFIATFQRTTDARSFFIPALAQRPVGLETAFSVDLSNGTPALRGLGIVLASWPTTDNPFKRPGVQIGVRRLTPDSERVFEQLLIARAGAVASEVVNDSTESMPQPPVGREPLATVKMEPLQLAELGLSPASPVANAPIEARTPGSEIVLPANPLADLSDEKLEGFIDCTLYEDDVSTSLEPEPRSRWWPLTALRGTLRRLMKSRSAA